MQRLTDIIFSRIFVRNAFLVFFIWLGWELFNFYLWAKGIGPHSSRPDGFAGLIPVGAFMSFFLWLKTGYFDQVAPAGVVIIIGALLTSLIFKKAFCGWICPVGAASQLFCTAGKKLFGRVFWLPRKVDITLRGFKYVISFAFIFWLASVSTMEAMNFQKLPYYAIADVKILILLVNLTVPYIPIFLAIAASGIFLGNVWCRYLCPLGGLYGLLGTASPCTVYRNKDKCIGCGKCAAICHANVPVNITTTDRAPECDGCLECVKVCPVEDALTARTFFGWVIPPAIWTVLVISLWFTVYAVARYCNHWNSSLPENLIAQYIRMLM